MPLLPAEILRILLHIRLVELLRANPCLNAHTHKEVKYIHNFFLELVLIDRTGILPPLVVYFLQNLAEFSDNCQDFLLYPSVPIVVWPVFSEAESNSFAWKISTNISCGNIDPTQYGLPGLQLHEDCCGRGLAGSMISSLVTRCWLQPVRQRAQSAVVNLVLGQLVMRLLMLSKESMRFP